MPLPALRLEPATLFLTLQELAIAQSLDLWVVGGWVRDALLGRTSIDLDLIVSAKPEAYARAIARPLKGHAVVLDAEFGVVRVHAPEGRVIDVARLQGESLESDLSRRDLTINALAVPLVQGGQALATPEVCDPTGGLGDLERRICRAIHEDNLVADPVRLLRVVRIAAELDWAIDPETTGWLDEHRRRLLDTAFERVSVELGKILAVPRAYPWLERLFGLGLLEVLIPELALMARLPAPTGTGLAGIAQALETARQAESLLGSLPDSLAPWRSEIAAALDAPIEGEWNRRALFKLASFLLSVGKPFCQTFLPDGSIAFQDDATEGAKRIEAIARRLKLSNRARDWLATLVREQYVPDRLALDPGDPVALYRFFRTAGDATVPTLLLALAQRRLAQGVREGARLETAAPAVLQAYFRPDRALTEPRRLLDGKRLMQELNLAPGKQVGILLEGILEEQLRGRVTSPEEAIAWARTRQEALG
jgi:tRNA nucleotidyltransferase/poly(A) polymerase